MEEAARLKYYLALSVCAGHRLPHLGTKSFIRMTSKSFGPTEWWILLYVDPANWCFVHIYSQVLTLK